MSRAETLRLIENHKPFNLDEARNKFLTYNFLKDTPQAFERIHEHGGHMCGSAVVANLQGTHVLLNRHKIIDIYLNFGGHADGDENLYAVARKELEEESGITNAECTGNLFDIDVQYIASHVRKGQPVPEHVHYDLTWLYRIDDKAQWKISDESTDIRWFSLADALALTYTDAQMPRLYQKIAAGLR